jgi:C4-dicarboxylate transporter DctM subunit
MAIWAVVILAVLVLSAVPVAAVLGILTFLLDQMANDGRLTPAIGEFVWGKSIEFILVAIPMFILLGEIMLRTGIAQRMYGAVVQWLSWLPGGLMHANIGTSTIFAATSGSSVATAATVGTVSYPEIAKRNYNESLFLGSLAAGGTLGILIPPSINLIIYGLITDTSVPELYLAGIFPGLILALLFVVVVGSIYAGLATPTEAASVGVIFACGLAAWTRTLNLTMLKEAFEGTMRTTAMIMLIIFAAVFLNFILGFMGVTQEILQAISSLGLTPLETMLIIIVFYLILGMFMETLSMMLTTVPIVFPIVASLGYDPVWFGIMITVLMETALITPPIGVNLYVVHGIRSGGGRFNDVAYGAAPFVVAMIAMIALLLMAPGLALWLPGLVY